MPDPNDPRYTFWYPADRPDPEEGVFEVGLVLAGAVSAGAYTAGVLDFLYEALDTWHRAKLADLDAGRTGDDRTVPHHKVRLHIVTGASAGGMNGAISAVALRYDFPRAWSHAKIADAQTAPDQQPDWFEKVDRGRNPFYSAWVEKIDITKLLGTADLDRGVHSLLDCTVLDEIVRSILGYQADRLQNTAVRAWMTDPLPLILTVTNLRGVPYEIIFRGEGQQSHEMSLHEDHMAFSLTGLGPEQRRGLPDDFLILDPSEADGWEALGTAALATGAFPVGLKARSLERDGADYGGRHPIVDPDSGGLEFDTPAWDPPPNPYKFLSVDGGVMNNEPFEIARRALAGLEGRNPRQGHLADRAVVMIDPFIEPGDLGPADEVELHRVFLSMVTAMKNQARFTPRDRALIQSEEVYSRFLIAPSRNQVRGAGAIASGALGAFMGFFSEAYRHHDFMLGRRNCQRFLQASFTLPLTNEKLFRDTLSPQARQRYADKVDGSSMQIIPCVGPCEVEEPLPDWPTREFAYRDAVQALAEKRVDRFVSEVFARVSGQKDGGSLLKKLGSAIVRAYLWPIQWKVAKEVRRTAKKSVEIAVRDIDGRFSPG